MLLMKKKLLLIIIFIGFSVASVFATTSNDIGRIEDEIFGFQYTTETDVMRLDRIEQSVYNLKSTQSVQQRIDKLNSDLGIMDTKTASTPYMPKADESVSYPMVDRLEMATLGKTYEDEDIYKRIDRLQMKVFKQKTDGDLNSKVDALASVVFNNAQPKSDIPSADTTNAYTASTNSDNLLQLSALEQTALRQTFSQDPTAVRLSRLERKIFDRDYSLDPEQIRLERLAAAQTAKKTAKYYDSNRAQKFVSTGLQVGTIILMILALIL